ncbi:uncharacterized protein KIAA1958-like [Haliotis rufescens]|uniref:uncharacterized protein KIAA1958-like n=1 Tax=Haliotis rufescens TaxID=6454 RepID=UPI00201E8F27|nr:uncharacterized protein KIAA1958-like [Haliotis rufescens]
MSSEEEGGDLFLTQRKFVETKDVSDDADDFHFRFASPLSEEELQKKLDVCVPQKTKYKNDWAVGVFRRWQEERRQRSIAENFMKPLGALKDDFENMDASDMNMALKYFLVEARKADGSMYPSVTMHGLYTALASSLKLGGSKFNLMQDDAFADARKSLDAVMHERSSAGLGADVRKHTEAISREEENCLWEKGCLGESNPQQLLDTIVYLTGLYFALRGGKEHQALRLHQNPQITGPFVDNNGRRYFKYREDVSKTNTGGIRDRKLERKEVRAYVKH